MPGWIWVVLVLFFFAMFISGAIYVLLRIKKGIETAGRTGMKISSSLKKLAAGEESEKQREAPIFTRPLSEAAEAYSDAHAEKIRRKDAAHRKHRNIWAKWAKMPQDNKSVRPNKR